MKIIKQVTFWSANLLTSETDKKDDERDENNGQKNQQTSPK